ncbi:hypothetical protein TEA_017702 [Camellia sinensis var. sinensis]|uniref:Uncharacterized protein n=1 Tax=Camellia sinensis var. sinensis TaxID=542762 RepID=A0A4S4CXY5_CAMSN|nr:hypothetical protein TEA_017702 [Camellia sinensis var. sinensis]
MSQLAFLDLCGNQLTGPIPLYAIGFSRLAYLDFKNNSLNGTIPSWLFTLPSLVSIELSGNKLQEQIPGSVYELANLTHSSFSSNNLSGIVELDKLLRLKYLSHLDLSHNGLSLSINNSVNSTMPKFYTIGLASCKQISKLLVSSSTSTFLLYFFRGLNSIPWKMGVMSRRVLPICGKVCFFYPSLRARSRQPVKRYKNLLADIFPRSREYLASLVSVLLDCYVFLK